MVPFPSSMRLGAVQTMEVSLEAAMGFSCWTAPHAPSLRPGSTLGHIAVHAHDGLSQWLPQSPTPLAGSCILGSRLLAIRSNFDPSCLLNSSVKIPRLCQLILFRKMRDASGFQLRLRKPGTLQYWPELQHQGQHFVIGAPQQPFEVVVTAPSHAIDRLGADELMEARPRPALKSLPKLRRATSTGWPDR